jgi:DNA-binding LacI/PurR family transcriptional regulator
MAMESRMVYELYNYILPLYERAFATRGITAWVCCTDPTAMFAVDFLKKRGVRVPEDISVVGFDDSREFAYALNLTSYNFGAVAIAYRMLSFILNPKAEPASRLHKPIDVDGVMIERGTTARAR